MWLHTVATVTWPRALHRLHSGSRSNCAFRVRCQRAVPYRWAKALPPVCLVLRPRAMITGRWHRLALDLVYGVELRLVLH